MTEKHSPLREALRLLGAEDERQAKLHEILETIREQIRTGVEPEHRPEGLFKNIQDAVYAMRGRTPLLDDAAIVSVFDGLPEAIAALEEIRREAATANEIIRLKRGKEGQGFVRIATALHRIEQLAKAKGDSSDVDSVTPEELEALISDKSACRAADALVETFEIRRRK